jgi:transposase
MTSQNGSIDGKDLAAPPHGVGRPDPEVPERLERARRRQFTVGYKLRILSEADAARTTGEIGGLLRREGLYSSHLAAWRRQREEGILNALSPRRRGRPSSSPEQRELARLRQENERLSQRLVAAETVIEVQKTRTANLRCQAKENVSEGAVSRTVPSDENVGGMAGLLSESGGVV